MRPRRTILATARAITASRLSRRISALAGYEVVGHAQDLSSAYMLCERLEPDLALIGRELTRLPEFEGLVSLLRVAGMAWIEIPDILPGDGGSGLLRASADGDAAEKGLISWLETAKALKHVTTATRGPNEAAATRPAPSGGFQPDKIILIGASTGGIDALLTILSAFPADCPPCAIVQHTGAGFSDSLVRLFSRCCAAKVVPAASGQPLLPGTVVVGAGCPGHLTLQPGPPRRCELTPGPPISGHTPSIDMLFRSAVSMAPTVTAVLLTGMGRDGAAGLLDLRRAGATTFAQDEETSTVYGMPRAAVEIGAAMESLALNRIAGELLGQSRKRASVPLAR